MLTKSENQPMNRFLQLAALLAVTLPLSARAQQGGDGLLSIRAVLHDPVHPVAELYLPDRTGAVVKLKLVGEGLAETQIAKTANGSLVLFDKAGVDLKNPAASLAATAQIPAGMKRAIVVVVPNNPGMKPAYRMVLIDDSPGVFPGGESRVLSMVAFDAALEAGEHKLQLKPAGVTRVPAVKKVNEYNMAQTNFFYKENGVWTPFTERQLQYLEEYRRVFLVYVTPGSTQPFVTTIVDTVPAVMPPAPGG